jgi:REP element-mobilizing transposase RayT
VAVAVRMQLVPVEAFQAITVDSTVMEKAIAHPTDSRLLEVARARIIRVAKAAGFQLKQTFAREAQHLRWKAGGYAHARQFRRLRRVIRRQRTILGVVLRDIQRQRAACPDSPALAELDTLRVRAERIRTQQPKDKNKLYALHAPEVECIGKGKARKPYEFGVKAGLAITHEHGLIVGARTFPGNPYDGHTLNEQLEQATILLEGIAPPPKTVYVDLGYRGVDQDNPDIEIIHRGKLKSLTPNQRQALKRRQAIEPVIGHLKSSKKGSDTIFVLGFLPSCPTIASHMARLPRFVIPGQPQHIIQRGNNRQALFGADPDYRFFRGALVEAATQHGLAIHAYVWMTHHLHVLATPESGHAISKVFQSVGRRYVQYLMPPIDAAAPSGRGATARRWWTASGTC